MVVFSHESSTGDNQVIMMLGIQAHGDDDFVPSFSVTLLFVAYFQLKIPKALVVIKIQLWNLTWCCSIHLSWFIQKVLLIKWKLLYLCNMEYIKITEFSRCLCKIFVKSQKWMWASALCTFYTNPAPLNGSMQFHYCTLVTREPEQTTLLFWSAACGVTPHGLHTADRR